MGHPLFDKLQVLQTTELRQIQMFALFLFSNKSQKHPKQYFEICHYSLYSNNLPRNDGVARPHLVTIVPDDAHLEEPLSNASAG